MQTVITTTNGCDYILLVDNSDRVVSAWTAEPKTINDYLCDSEAADEWAEESWPDCNDGDVPELRTIAGWGEEYGRNGVIDDESRAEFWGVFSASA